MNELPEPLYLDDHDLGAALCEVFNQATYYEALDFSPRDMDQVLDNP